MKEKLVTVGTLVCLFVLTCLLLIHALAIFPGVTAIRWFFVTSAVVLGRLDAPAWVQAVGSIVAIAAAGGTAVWQTYAARRDASARDRKATSEKAMAIFYILRRAELVAQNAQRALHINGPAVDLAADQLEFVQEALRGLPIFEIPSAKLVFFLQRTDRDLLYILRIVRLKLEGSGRAKPVGSGLFQRIVRRLRTGMRECVDLIDPQLMSRYDQAEIEDFVVGEHILDDGVLYRTKDADFG
ncbi:hypothetical protein A3K87_09930 [Variovorax paradoxus]|uniref:Uncharacterized protein n=1 Tax=Variovorax paradoxus TaxID=34073 RepID=A0AA91ICF2_VARPD|nr:hypothetical protein [Variovorax paradoxus]OAK66074.1 hypothetical protein A3K87_09930 [Variovorax paradoxus]